MAYFEDLTPYAYGHWSKKAPDPTVLSIGWLDKSESFTSGVVNTELADHLYNLIKCPVNLYRGSHTCQYCCNALGNGEIRIYNEDITYVAPVLIAHYVREHGYQPPAAFVKAVMQDAGLR